jgi:hypothetical protein
MFALCYIDSGFTIDVFLNLDQSLIMDRAVVDRVW